jgi:hypothetical protein
VRYAIEGSVSTSARGGNLTARLVDAPTGEVLWTERYPISDPEMAVDLLGDLAAKVAEAIGRPLGDGVPSGRLAVRAGPKREAGRLHSTAKPRPRRKDHGARAWTGRVGQAFWAKRSGVYRLTLSNL